MRRAPLLAGVLASWLTGCAPSPTQLVVVVDTDLAIPTELDQVTVEVTGPGGTMERESSTLADGASLPLTLGVAAGGDALGPIEVVAIGRLDGRVRVARTHRVELVRGETRMLVMHLARACAGTSCDAGRTCAEQGCVPVELEGGELPGWAGAPPRLDRDGGRTDGGVADGGPQPCETATECDDDNPCTDDACTATGCVSTTNAAACDDGLFCTGLDRCVAGTCTGAGDPCGGATTCDETANVCEGCSADDDCPGPTEGAWGACDFGGSSCGESGTATRTVVSFACEGSACVPRETTETQPCARETDGDLCASRSCGAFGACGDFASACATEGTRSRTCSHGVCGAGSCTTQTVQESEACTRSTDGDECAPETCGTWGACSFPSVCATSGTQTRTCMAAASCSGGSCGAGATRTETQACTRGSRDGTSCGVGRCGAWGTCTGEVGSCDTRGTQTRSCDPQVCSAGACITGAALTESQPCTRDVTGLSCDDGDFCTNLDRCTSTGLCSGRFCARCCEIEPL